MLKELYLRKAIAIIDSEIELLKINLSLQTNMQLNKKKSSKKSEIYFIPKSKGLGIDSMGEFAIAFSLSDDFFDKNGNPAPLVQIAEVLEDAFNFSFGDIYKTKSRIFSRKPYNLTKSFDSLRNLLIRENKKRKMKKDEFVAL